MVSLFSYIIFMSQKSNVINFNSRKRKKKFQKMKSQFGGNNNQKLYFIIIGILLGICIVMKASTGLVANPATMIIIGLNFLVFAAVYFNKLRVDQLGTSYNRTIENKEYYRVFTAAFTHQEIWHILMNMYSLYNLGQVLERVLGSVRFLIVYIIIMIVGGIIAACVHKTHNPYVYSIGASGVLCGLLGIYMVIAFLMMGLSGIAGCIPTILILILMTFSKRIDSIGHFVGLGVGIIMGIILIIL